MILISVTPFCVSSKGEKVNMDLKSQASAPLCEAIEKFRKKRIVPFDVPGHKRGRGNPELVDLLGERCVGIDVN